jgi:hypothetical protein
LTAAPSKSGSFSWADLILVAVTVAVYIASVEHFLVLR